TESARMKLLTRRRNLTRAAQGQPCCVRHFRLDWSAAYSFRLQTLGRFVNVTIICHCREDQQRRHRHLLKKCLTERSRSPPIAIGFLSSFLYLNDSPVDAYFRQKSLNRASATIQYSALCAECCGDQGKPEALGYHVPYWR